jgi:hypothetical protein
LRGSSIGSVCHQRLCLKPGKTSSAPVKHEWYENCRYFLKGTIDVVAAQVAVTNERPSIIHAGQAIISASVRFQPTSGDYRGSPENVCCSVESRSSAAGGKGPFSNCGERILKFVRRSYPHQNGPNSRMRDKWRDGRWPPSAKFGSHARKQRPAPPEYRTLTRQHCATHPGVAALAAQQKWGSLDVWQ